jgi:hypothetical protein
MENSLQSVIAKLENLFSEFNSKYFENSLEKPIIAVNHDHTASAFGWFTTWKAWSKEGTDGFYEINVCAEHLNRPIYDICATLIHEMVHIYNQLNEIKDTSRAGTYHNKKFKVSAEEHGLIIENTEKYGWTKTSLQESTKEFIDTLELEAIGLHRSGATKADKVAKKSSSKKYICHTCGLIIRATREVRVTCTDCDIEMTLEDNDEE